EGIVTYTIPALPLLEGLYYVSVSAHNWEDTEMFDYHDRLYAFRVLPGAGERYGIVTFLGEWSWNGTGMS
ncbi:MAG: ABC transporter ATP-binding protein, partial [Anaerolineae bacterium]